MKLLEKPFSDRKSQDKLLVTIGSFLTVNGLLLMFAPGEFVTLRQAGWMPDRINDSIDSLGRDYGRGRSVGLIATVLGATLLVIGVVRTRPAH